MLDLNQAGRESELLDRYGVDSINELFGPDGDVAEWVVRRDEELKKAEAAANRGFAGGQSSSSAGERWVSSKAIKEAVSGQELTILNALGIRWTGAHGHIDCPYPYHGGKSDWRWDAAKRAAFCTCMERHGDKKAHSIFDIVMAVERIDFEAAKLRIAEMIGRGDLILIKRGQSSHRYQKTDADSLLSASAADRDDGLVYRYLGHRLGLDPDAVPRPSTPVVGWLQLPYFDPPQTERGKPVYVCSTPCAVFGQIDCAGGRHAHRIYLRPDGHGKADLGLDAEGQQRNPKKSARALDDNTAGRAVLWGNTETATLAIVVEGIETGAAVAVAFRCEIEAGTVLVAAAVSATGVEAFRPWPAIKDLIVAADRDEGVSESGRVRDSRGERAARILCLRVREHVRCGIALPGVASEKIDWLDILYRDGIAAVRDGVFKPVLFEPTEQELGDEANRRGRDKKLDEIAETYSVPRIHRTRLVYAYADGKIKLHKVIGFGQERELIPVATPFAISTRLRYADQADTYGVRCVIQDMNGQPRAVDFDRALLGKAGATDIRSMLYAAGLRVENDGEAIVLEALKSADPDKEIIVVGRPGWHQLDCSPDPLFVSPGGTPVGVPDGIEVELVAAARITGEVAISGTAENWQRAVAAAVSAPDCLHWTLGVTAGFAGTVVSLTGLESCGINLSGQSTSGKSTAQRLAASCWSSPDIRKKGLMKSALNTGNAIERQAQGATGTVLPLDELAHVSGKDAAKMIYTIAGNVGKGRMNPDATIREPITWSTFAILSCETNLEDKVRSDGSEWRAGMAARFPDIDVAGVNRNVDAATLTAIDGIEHHYGHAGVAFARAIVNEGLHRQAAILRDQVLKAAKEIAGGDDADAAAVRAARPLALLLIAGKMAVGFGLLPATMPVTEAVQWAWAQFTKSSDAGVLDPKTQMISHLGQWIAEGWDVTIKSVDADTGVNNREAQAWYDNDAVYIPKGRIRQASSNVLKEGEIGNALSSANLLARQPEPDRYYVRWIPKIGKVDAYALSRQAFGKSTASSGFRASAA